MFHSYTESEHQKYFPCLFASQLPPVQCSKFYLLFLCKIFVTKRTVWLQENYLDKSSKKEEKERFMSPSLLSKISSSKLEESFQVKEH